MDGWLLQSVFNLNLLLSAACLHILIKATWTCCDKNTLQLGFNQTISPKILRHFFNKVKHFRDPAEVMISKTDLKLLIGDEQTTFFMSGFLLEDVFEIVKVSTQTRGGQDTSARVSPDQDLVGWAEFSPDECSRFRMSLFQSLAFIQTSPVDCMVPVLGGVNPEGVCISKSLMMRVTIHIAIYSQTVPETILYYFI